MADHEFIGNELSKVEKLEKELNLKHLQIKSLLTITQAINDNVSSDGLFNMYKSFLSWEMPVKKMALMIRNDDHWEFTASINSDINLNHSSIIRSISKYKRLHTIDLQDHEALQDFDIIIPVYHKKEAIAFSLIGGFDEEQDLYSKIQFITTITNIIAVAIENKRLFKKQLRQERFKKEMELAENVQKMLIPSELPKRERFEVASIYKPHLNVGGDFFDFIEFDDQHFALCIADISGKGVAAALLMANVQAKLSGLIHKHNDLKELIIELNRSVYEITRSERFLTFFIAMVDLENNELFYVNSGHNPPLFFQKEKMKELKCGSTVLGAFEDLPYVEIGLEKIHKGDMLITYTDGLTDLMNEDGENFDEEMLKSFLVENFRLNPNTFNNLLLKTIEEFKGLSDYSDDIAILSCKFKDK